MGNWYDVEMRIEDKNIIKKIKDCIFINPDALGINKEKLEFDGEEFCHYIDLAYFFGMRDELVGEKDLTTEELNEVNELANWKHYNEFAPGYLFDDEYIQKGYAVLSLKQGGYYPRGLLVYISKLTPLKEYPVKEYISDFDEITILNYILKNGEVLNFTEEKGKRYYDVYDEEWE